MGLGLLERVLGISKTKSPGDPGCWKYSKGKVEIEWARAPELRKPCGATRLEGRGLPERVLVIYGMDGQYHAFRNSCTYGSAKPLKVFRVRTKQCKVIVWLD